MVVLIIVQILLLVLQILSLVLLIKTDDDFWLLISNIFFAGVIGITVFILMSYGLA